MSKYILEIQRETKREYTQKRNEYYEDNLTRLKELKHGDCTFTIGNKWVEVFESRNKLSILKFDMLNKKEFFEYCSERGIKFTKK